MVELHRLEEALCAAGLDPDAQALDRFARFAALLTEWNDRVNLISRKDPYSVIERHFLDSAGLAVALDLQPGARVLDLGSGGGFPGLPLAILRPDIHLVSVESRQKKAAFQEVVVEALNLSNVSVLAQRVEQVPAETGPFDWVVSRAVADLETLAGWCRHLILRPGGRMAVIKGPDLDEEVRALAKRAKAWGVRDWEVRDYRPFGPVRDKESRLVVVHW